jgi:hypothetical protein
MSDHGRPELAELTIADPPDRWRALGFAVDDDGHLDLGGVRITLGALGTGIRSWSLRNITATGSIDGLATSPPSLAEAPPSTAHPNGATGLDHIVVLTGDFGRTAVTLEQLGMPLKHARELNGSRGFVRIGPAILELVHVPQLDSPDACFWGLAIVVRNLEELAARLGSDLGRIKAAVQPGRRIATLAASAGCSTAVAFMTPRPP